MFLLNVGWLSTDYGALYPWRQNSSRSYCVGYHFITAVTIFWMWRRVVRYNFTDNSRKRTDSVLGLQEYTKRPACSKGCFTQHTNVSKRDGVRGHIAAMENEKCLRSFGMKTSRDHTEDESVHRKIILKMILQKYLMGMDWIHVDEDGDHDVTYHKPVLFLRSSWLRHCAVRTGGD
jgi:hypothetical protein